MRLFALWCGLVSPTAFAQEREWSWDMTDEDAYLVFGTPNTDDVGLSLWCKIGSGTIKFVVPSHTVDKNASTTKLALETDGANRFDLSGNVESSEQEDIFIVETELQWDSPVIAAIERADVLSVTIGGHMSKYPLVDADVASLTKVCRKR